MKVLVADDSQTMRKIVVQMLRQIGYADIREAEDGQQALELLQSEGDFGLLLTDWNMPRLSGLDLTLAVRADARLARLPILMVTTRTQKRDIVAAMKAGADNYVTKPFLLPTLEERIRRVLG